MTMMMMRMKKMKKKKMMNLKPDIFQNFYKLLSDVVNVDCQGNIDKDLEGINQINQKLEDKFIT